MEIHNIDLQYHAGQERQTGVTLEEYLDHARQTGRTVLGLTDHLDLYETEPAVDDLIYEPSIDGWVAYRRDVEDLREVFPDIQLLFAPEIGDTDDIDSIPDRLIDISDLFICELPSPGRSVSENTTAMVDRIARLATFSDRVGRPLYLAHPFRSAVDARFVKNDIHPWITDLESRHPDEFTLEEVNALFEFDVVTVARAAAEQSIPLEINGETHRRLRSANLPAPLQMLRAGYRFMEEAGATFVPGSDQHQFQVGFGRVGRDVPWETFEYLGIEAADLDHLTEFGIDPSSPRE